MNQAYITSNGKNLACLCNINKKFSCALKIAFDKELLRKSYLLRNICSLFSNYIFLITGNYLIIPSFCSAILGLPCTF